MCYPILVGRLERWYCRCGGGGVGGVVVEAVVVEVGSGRARVQYTGLRWLSLASPGAMLT